MDKDQVARQGMEFKGMVKQEWSKLSEDDLSLIESRADALSGCIQRCYGVAKEEAERQIESFKRRNRDIQPM